MASDYYFTVHLKSEWTLLADNTFKYLDKLFKMFTTLAFIFIYIEGLFNLHNMRNSRHSTVLENPQSGACALHT